MTNAPHQTSDAVSDLEREALAAFEDLTIAERNVRLAAERDEARIALAEALASKQPRAIRRATRRLDDAKTALFAANVGIAEQWAKRFRRQGDLQTALEYRDAAREGLVEACETWDPSKGAALATWAWPRIKKALFGEVVSNEHHMSNHAFQFRPRVKNAIETLRAAGAEITDEAIAAMSSVPVPMVARIRQADAAGSALSLDARLGDGDGSALADVLDLDDHSMVEAPDWDLADLARLTAHVPLTELWVGMRYHGADGGPAETLAVIGAGLGRSREMARKAVNRFKAAVIAGPVVPDEEDDGQELDETLDETLADTLAERRSQRDPVALTEALAGVAQESLFG